MNSSNELIDIRWAFFEVAQSLLLICNASKTFYSFSYSGEETKEYTQTHQRQYLENNFNEEADISLAKVVRNESN